MNKIKKKSVIFWFVDLAYAIVFGLIIGADLGFDVTKKLNKHFG
ncbi:hypothetical protein GCM10008904_07300 [Paraclostridium ghonii]|uniref:Uncharacterized protein n=1 Tax=Paraclostridium ghonii TaxID=29358 RepID=A0ABU0N2V0_9FIRM|nr:hypothetical protein [Paeniclostridium ghonii]MDQ0557465.1 hypothetical protein [Paeniclostridium ghonii]